MARSLHSLSALIDFESAARWTSFQRAARELRKTPAAVSQQIKQLEHALGFKLFARHPRHVALTDKGRELATTASRVLGELHAKIAALQDGDDEHVLRVSTTHSFAMKWLVPRLHRFTTAHPQFDLRVDANDREVPLDDGACDVAVRYSPVAGDGPDLAYREQLIVVYSRTLEPRPRASLAALLRHPLLYETTPAEWVRVLELNRLTDARPRFSRRYSHSGLVVQAAAAGLGVALVQYALAAEDLAHDRLQRASCTPLASTYGYRVLSSPAKRDMAKVMRFDAWIRGELIALRDSQ